MSLVEVYEREGKFVKKSRKFYRVSDLSLKSRENELAHSCPYLY